MKIILREKVGGRFLSKSGDWIPYSGNVWEFSSASEAIKYCVATKTWNVDLILRFWQFGEPVDFPLEDASFAVAQIPPLPSMHRRNAAPTERGSVCG